MWGKTRRPLALCLLATLLFELSLLAGVLVSPFFPAWRPIRGLAREDPTAPLVRYRRSVASGEGDLRVGAPAPRLALRPLSGPPLNPAVFRGQKVALLFIHDGSG